MNTTPEERQASRNYQYVMAGVAVLCILFGVASLMGGIRI